MWRWGLDRGVLAAIIVIVAALIGATNFFAQFIVIDFKSDPIITTTFMAIAGLAAGVKAGKEKDKK